MTDVYLLVEGALDEVVLRQLLNERQSFNILQCFGKKGKAYLEERIAHYNNAAAYMPFICLVDLDNENCPPALMSRILPSGRHANLLVRVAVREIEAWLIADRENFATFIGVSQSKIPFPSDMCPDPKRAIVNLARKSRIKIIRDDMIPADGSTSKVGKNYVGQLMRFVQIYWNIDNAMSNSPSLERAMKAFQSFSPVL